MDELGASSLGSEQIERLCEVAEEAARNYIISRVSWREISDLNIAVETGGSEKNLLVDVDVEVRLSPLIKDFDAKKLAEEAVNAAFKSVEKFLREDQWGSKE